MREYQVGPDITLQRARPTEEGEHIQHKKGALTKRLKNIPHKRKNEAM